MKCLKAGLLAVNGVMLAWSGLASAADAINGGKLYARYCENCHGGDGAGRIPGAPDFSRGERMLQPDSTLVDSIKNGMGMMPAYRGQLTTKELFDLTAYLRTLRR